MVSTLLKPKQQQTLSGWQVRENCRLNSDHPEIWSLLDSVCDPEIPAISLWELGVLNDIVQQQGKIIITITPTYSGCPAIETMTSDILNIMKMAGFYHVSVVKTLAPAWSTEFMTAKGHEKLQKYGIAPPLKTCPLNGTPKTGIACPHCGSHKTALLSEFGSTACKALYSCRECYEPFDFFKNI